MNPTIEDRIIAVVSYFTFGFFSLVWLIIAAVFKKQISRFLIFNLYQAIFMSLVFYVVALLYSKLLEIFMVIPFIGDVIRAFDIFFNQTPIYFSFTLSGLFSAMIVFYVSIMALLGLKSYIPYISDIIEKNIRM